MKTMSFHQVGLCISVGVYMYAAYTVYTYCKIYIYMYTVYYICKFWGGYPTLLQASHQLNRVQARVSGITLRQTQLLARSPACPSCKRRTAFCSQCTRLWPVLWPPQCACCLD